jgi:outer membrane protein assembly factor BamB
MKPVAHCFVAMLSTAALLAANSTGARAGDWPQILGPDRNGEAQDEKLAESWPKDGPKVLWTARSGSGFAGPAVAGKRVVLFHRVGDADRIEALDVRNGDSLWKANYVARYRGGVNPDSGPRCVPVIHDGNVYAFGASGDLHCVSLEDGSKRWTRKLYDDYRGDEGYFGAGSTPIVADGKLLVNVGGRDQAGLVALALDSGETVWKATDEAASYSSPTLANIDGRECAVFVTRMNVVAIDPANGEEVMRFPFGRSGPTVNAATPLVSGDSLFVTASYGIGARLAKLERGNPKIVWSSDDAMSSQYATAVYRDGYLYGIDGREDVGVAELRCIEAKSGKVAWTSEGFGVAHVILAGDKLLLLKVSGELVLASASPQKFEPLAEAKIAEGITRAMPALSNGRLYVRSNEGEAGTLYCLQVGERAE